MKDKIVRIKEIIITAGGENVAPTNIEEEIKTELPEVQNNVDTNWKEKIKLWTLISPEKFDPQESGNTNL